MVRFFIPPGSIHNNHFILEGSEARHAITVLRRKAGDTIDLFDGKDRSWVGRIEQVQTDRLEGILLDARSPDRGISARVTLFQSIMRGARWDWLLEKACEVGVSRVIPLVAARSVVKPGADPAGKLERWRRIALAASKQCGRPDLMDILAPVELPAALALVVPGSLSVIPWEKEMERSIAAACAGFSGREYSVFIGPEGGWEAREVALAEEAGVRPVRLGPTLLRSETAGMAAALLVLREAAVY